MRNAPALILAVALLAGVAAVAEDEFPILVYPVPLAKTPLALDGKLAEPAWQDAPLVSGFTLYGKADLAPVQTAFRVLYTPEALVVGVQCDEPEMDKLSPVTHARDEHAIFGTEAVEIFIDPGHTHDLYYQTAINSAGSLYDSERENPTWNGDTTVHVHRGAASWSAEVAFLWKDLGVKPERGRLLGFNICRDRQIGEARQWSNWARVQGGFHDVIRFGHLVLAPTPARIAELAPEFRQGDRRGPLLVFSAEGFSQTTYAALAAQALQDQDKLLADFDAEQRQEKDPAAAAELAKRLSAFRLQANEMRTVAQGRLDAATWTKLDMRIEKTKAQIRQGVWEARLIALLSEL